jgi:hypothetical protein
VVEVFAFGTTRIPTLRQGADRLPLGATVLQMQGEYTALTDLLLAVGRAFGEFHAETEFNIEFEYKKIVGEGLDVKQVRRIPGVTAGDTPPVLIDTSTSLCTFQGEYADVFANYRLKSRWQPEFANRPIAEEGGLFLDATHRYLLDGSVRELSGPPSGWPDASSGTFDPQIDGVLGFRQSWSVGSGGSRRVMTLTTLVPASIGPTRIPIVFPEDLGFMLEAEFDTAVPFLDFDNQVAERSAEGVLLLPCPDQRPLTAGHMLQERSLAHEGVAIDWSFYWPPPPTGAVAGYTAPLDRWVGTTIDGVGTTSVELHGYFSQTYRPEHHNFSENFVFDAHLEEGIDPAVLAEWDAIGLQALVVPSQLPTIPLLVLTRDGGLVELDSLR